MPVAPPPKPIPFSREDAQSILNIIRRAPLANLDEAESLSGSLRRFADYVQANVK
jgi:hypothetical protein